MKQVIIINSGTLKLALVSNAFATKFPEQEFEFFPLDVSYSGSDILSKDECLSVIRNSIGVAQKEIPNADYYVMMRGRFEETASGMEECALVVIRSANNLESHSQAVSFQVPDELATLVRSGVKFAKAVEQTYQITNVKDGTGYCGYLTDGIVTKGDQYFQATVIALSSLDKKS